jgi:glycosyltransferase involved in cell wall biosynthesis
MKIAVIVPSRGDRPKFLDNCLRMIKAQTLQPDYIHVANDKPLSASRDITWRYRKAYDALRGKGFDVIFFMEDDDYYHPEYIETMLRAWIAADRPEIFGTTETIYYHIKIFASFIMNHHVRSSAMCTLIKPDLEINWPVDEDPYTDIALYKQLKYALFTPPKILFLGIKHGVGLCGGDSHVNGLHRYVTGARGKKDHNRDFLRSVMDPESFEFYTNYFN